ncbi:hypothetical protein [Endozoicomonas ascidiicola]|uniref:hypothetical protein n=1 Tax=Endozoicomonas ascidiicola TaxID=1698521 RepID=UPI00083792DD|nr:hypothetical protein [Endozoicomonas ascidiicola]
MSDKQAVKMAKELGYSTTAVHRNSMEEAVQFMEKITQRVQDKNLRHEIMYATQVVINTMAVDVSKKAINQSEDKRL